MRKYKIYYDGVNVTPSDWILKRDPDGLSIIGNLLVKIIKLFICNNEWFIVNKDDLINESHLCDHEINLLISNNCLNDEIVLSDGVYVKLTKKAITEF